MSIQNELKPRDHLGTRLSRAGLLFLYMAAILLALYVFAHRWSAFALLVPGIAVVVVVVFLMRIARVLRFRSGERRNHDRRHADRRHEELAAVREPLSATTPAARGERADRTPDGG